MKKVFYLLTLLVLVGLSNTGFAQTAGMLTGSVTDEAGTAVGFANVAVLDAATAAVVTGAIADLDGNFKIKSPAKGKYLLKITSLGYVTNQTEAFEVTDENFQKEFGKLQMKSDAKVLKEVQVEAMRPTIVNHPDKMVVSVENTALAAGSTALEVLEKSPGVWVDQDGNIQLNGKTGVQVMLNGKRSFLTGKELQNLLQSMSADNIKDLEIITNPSSRYDAEGTSGIININLKKNVTFGLSGSVYGGYQYNRLNTYTTGANISHKSGKWNTTANLDVARRMRFRDVSMERIFDNEGVKSNYDQTGYEESERISPALRLGTDYDLNDRHSIGATVNLNYADNKNLFRTDSYLRSGNPETDSLIKAVNTIDGNYRNSTINLHYSGKLDSAGTTTLSTDLDYVNINSQDNATFDNRYQSLFTGAPARIDMLYSDNPTQYDIYSAKVDFGMKLGKNGKMELGAKASHVTSDNELLFFETRDGRRVEDPKRTNHFLYKEDIFAAYTNYTTKLGDKWSLQAGLRAEQTISEGNSLTKKEITDRSYLDFFPSVFLQQKVSDKYQVSYKYSRRINRPYYGSLNPFIFYLDPYSWATGNPYLRPQYTNSFEVTQTLKDSYILVLGYHLTKDFMGEVPKQNPEDNTTVFQQRNMDQYENLTASLMAPVRISSNWEMSNSGTVSYMHYTNNGDIKIDNEQLMYMAQSNQNIKLPMGVRLELTGAYQSAGVYGLYEFKGNWWVDAGIKRSFLDDKLAVTLNATDIFKSRQLDINTTLNGNTNRINQYQGAQSVRLNIRYRFSKGKEFETKRRNTNLDELNRTGGN